MLHPSHPSSPPPRTRSPRRFTPFTCRRTRAARQRAVVTMLAMVVTTNGGPLMTPTAHAQETARVGFVLNAGDLRFIYRQIEIAQAHAAGGQLLGPNPNQINEPRLPFGLRTVDGSFNHLSPGTDGFGAADRVFPRLTTPIFRDADDFDPDGPGPAPEVPTSYKQKTGTVADAQPRIISNLIADQTIRNPAAVAVSSAENGGAPVTPDPLGTLPILNVAPDVGLSAPFNTMFTFFGQFFDHGLDLVTKGGGTVFVPLQPDDPLFDQGPNFMILSRATNQPGPDGVAGDDPATPEDESADDVQEATNTTTPFVDQNQTYTSHPSHQVFLREYAMVNGRPVSTGRFIDGGGTLGAVRVKNIGNWGEVKAQAAAMLGIGLVDSDVLSVPLLATDPYGRFLRGPNGFPMLIMADNSAVEGNPAAPVSTAGSKKTGHAFLDDIAHNAVPAPGLAPDADGVAGSITAPPLPGTYDDELLAAHFITGDGRGNENIALTSVHTIFHAEHNRMADALPSLIDSLLTPTERAAWRAVDGPSGWDFGERIFQAARFTTEMQYQHLVFEEFARKLVPSINAFIGDGINFRSLEDPAITAEFAHAVYRLGHSMLTETIARTNVDGSHNDIALLDGFLNPLEFNNGGPAGPLTAAQAAGAIFQGGLRRDGNAIDEFVTEAVRNRLLGLPLDLAVLNLARGRSEGLPPLNVVRQQLYAATSDASLRPYDNWLDFEFALKHQASLVNYIAAYGVDPQLQAATSVADRRARAEVLMADANFMFAPASQSGVDAIDLWIGGLAEKIAPFGSMLGTTFNYVFETQLERLQDLDRFYYLERLDGLNLLTQLEGNSFAEVIKRNTTLTGAPADVFSRPGLVFNLTSILRTPGVISDDPSTPENETTLLVLLPNGTVRYNGPEHVIWNGRNPQADRVISSEGDDTLTGDGGNDVMEGGAGNDGFVGGEGDDILTDVFGADVIKGGPGDDAISGGTGPFDLLQGNEGNDFIVAGGDETENFGGPGNDVIYMGAGLSESVGGAGDDWMEGTNAPASIAIGDDNNQFQNDPNGGHDIALAGPGDMDFDMEGGDDIMVGSVLPTHRFEGMLGFDWVTYRGETQLVDADMLVTGAIAVNAPLNELRDRFDLTEGLSGTTFNDRLRGDNRDAAILFNDGLTGVNGAHVLNAEGIARIAGLAAILPAGATSWGEGNIILGGPGSDLLEGRGGNDILDGDRWLNVQLRGVLTNGTVRLANSLHELKGDVFSGALSPSAISYVRSIVATGALATGIDTALFTGPLGNYSIVVAADRTITVRDNVGTDGVDTVRNVERLQFADTIIPAPGPAPVGTPVPNLQGLTDAQARAAILGAGLTVGAVTTGNHASIAPGTVATQLPLAGVGVPSGTAVSFMITLGALVPDIHEQTVTDGRALLTAAGVAPGATANVNDPAIPPGLIVGTNPPAGTTVPPGTTVGILVSLGPIVLNTVPSVAGLLQADAREQIAAAGFTVGTTTFANSSTAAAGSVISTTPTAGTVLTAGAAVAMRVSLGTDGLVLAMGFEEGTGTAAVDSSVVARNGTIRGALRVPGKFGNALSFDGVDDWVTVADVTNSALDLSGGMTIEAWVLPTWLDAWETVVLKERGVGNLSYALYGHDGFPDPFGFNATAGYVRVNPVLSTTDQAVRNAEPLPIGAWTHIATTYDGANQRLYINGVLVATKAQTGTLAVSNGALRIGGNAAFAGEFFDGLIDEVRVYNKARTQAQIQADMNTPVR